MLSYFHKIFSRSQGNAGPQALSIETSRELDAPLFVLTGEIDHYSARMLRKAIEGELSGPDQVVLFDLNAVTYVDSGGLALLFDVVRALEKGWVGVIEPRRGVRRLLDISGLGGLASVRIFTDREEVRRALRTDGSTQGPCSAGPAAEL
ncbi:MAG: STAS domain-containing protein [Thermoleophilia bacterium]